MTRDLLILVHCNHFTLFSDPSRFTSLIMKVKISFYPEIITWESSETYYIVIVCQLIIFWKYFWCLSPSTHPKYMFLKCKPCRGQLSLTMHIRRSANRKYESHCTRQCEFDDIPCVITMFHVLRSNNLFTRKRVVLFNVIVSIGKQESKESFPIKQYQHIFSWNDDKKIFRIQEKRDRWLHARCQMRFANLKWSG